MLEEEEKDCQDPEATQRAVSEWARCEQGASMPTVQEGLFSQWIHRAPGPGVQQKEGRAFLGSDHGKRPRCFLLLLLCAGGSVSSPAHMLPVGPWRYSCLVITSKWFILEEVNVQSVSFQTTLVILLQGYIFLRMIWGRPFCNFYTSVAVANN